ncbi:von Willebrand factor type A [[Leptolyngbya] sp. PCC 7376]|uniref:VWA domain-containing protein n=1 Tax=[Leptolyngbya] sp. PCC 7376 TaxID=111781 RepID=UPI00029F13C3|nr:vWA domain-containing protein [[Leptolyngbya] sp. PCC 7376]AFY37969.1 von Willebrand factor type A [[Leptolyngbya] sp. PCC 7376]
MSFSRLFRTAALSLSLALVPWVAIAEEEPTIQLAILLDSSNSMDGLIDQTRSQIWNVVNALTDVRKDGQVPQFEVALYHYGNDSLPSYEGFNRQLTDFTPELDNVSEKLFEIQTNGGQEYSGWVIKSAVNQLNWDEDEADFRAIFIAGNEPFDQGKVGWQEAIALARSEDIIVNTIYCGSAENRERALWAEGAEIASGANFNINQNRQVIVQESPYDEDIRALNDQLNSTYIPYGAEGTRGLNRQIQQDVNAGAAIVTRGSSKGSAYYRNASWDLVDALEEEAVDLETLSDDELPLALQGLTLEEKEGYISEVEAEREEIKAQIRDFTSKREGYIRNLPVNDDRTDTLDYAMIQSLREQLARKGFVLE